MKKIKISLFAIIAIVMGVAGSAFNLKNTNSVEKEASYFYLYTSTSTSQSEIQKIENYERDDVTCEKGLHVCGVFLSTDQPIGDQPVASEFNAVKNSLWLSEQNHTAANPSIKMRN